MKKKLVRLTGLEIFFVNKGHKHYIEILKLLPKSRDNKSKVIVVAVVLISKIFKFDEETLKQKLETAIEMTLLPYAVLLVMADSEEKIVKTFENKPMIW